MAQQALTPTELVEPDIRPATAYLASLRTDVSRAAMRSELNKIARVVLGIAKEDEDKEDLPPWQRIPWQTLDAAKVRAIMSNVNGAPASRNKTLSALRGVAMRAYELHLIDADTWQRIGLVKTENVQRDDETLVGREIQDWELAALMRTCANDASPAGVRDAALIGLCAKTGARRAELAGLRLDAITKTADGYEIKATGKRGKVRTLHADNGARQALAAWLDIRGADIGDDAALFTRISQTGIVSNDGMTTTALDAILRKRCEQANVSDCDWHDFRRTFAGRLLDNGADISIVAQLMGHSNVATTQRYDRRPAETRRKAARTISVPYFEHRKML